MQRGTGNREKVCAAQLADATQDTASQHAMQHPPFHDKTPHLLPAGSHHMAQHDMARQSQTPSPLLPITCDVPSTHHTARHDMARQSQAASGVLRITSHVPHTHTHTPYELNPKVHRTAVVKERSPPRMNERSPPRMNERSPPRKVQDAGMGHWRQRVSMGLLTTVKDILRAKAENGRPVYFDICVRS